MTIVLPTCKDYSDHILYRIAKECSEMGEEGRKNQLVLEAAEREPNRATPVVVCFVRER